MRSINGSPNPNWVVMHERGCSFLCGILTSEGSEMELYKLGELVLTPFTGRKHTFLVLDSNLKPIQISTGIHNQPIYDKRIIIKRKAELVKI